MKKLMLIVNPSAGRGGYRYYFGEAMKVLADGGYRTELFFTAGPKEATELAKTYAADYPHNDRNTIIFLDWHVTQMKRSSIPDQKLRPSGGSQTEAAYTTFWSPFRVKVDNNW